MNSILSILCIIFFSVLIYGIISSSNSEKYYKDNCHTIYIPEHIDLEQAFDKVNHLSRDGLKKMSRTLGGSKELVESSSDIELKTYIIQNSLSDDNILFTDIGEDIKLRDAIKKREYCRRMERENKPNDLCIDSSSSLEEFEKLNIPLPITNFEYPSISTKDILQKTMSRSEIQNKNIVFDI